jgi:hypothetical protein
VAEGTSRAEVVEVVHRSAGRKGGGPAKRRKATSRVIRTAAGPRLTIEYRKGLDDSLILADLEEALAQVRAAVATRTLHTDRLDRT